MEKKIYNKKWFKVLISILVVSALVGILNYLILYHVIAFNTGFISINGTYISIQIASILLQQLILIPVIVMLASYFFNKYDFESRLNLVPYKDKKLVLEPERENSDNLEWSRPGEWLDKITFGDLDKSSNLVIINSEKHKRIYYMTYSHMKSIIMYVKNGRIIGYFSPKLKGKYTVIEMTRPYTKKRQKYE